MLENYDHYISRNIKAYYKRKIYSPIVYLIILVLVWNIFSLSELLFPMSLENDASLNALYQQETKYVTASLEDLHFTGYTRTFFGNTTGYYYYTMRNGECIFVLLTPKSSEEGLPTISNITVSVELIKNSDSYHTLLSHVAQDLNWTINGIQSKVAPYYLSEPDFNPTGNTVLFFFLFGTGLYALISVLLSLLYIAFPVLSPPCQDLGLYGDAKDLLEQAEDELVTLPQLATEDIFITEHFFIVTSYYGTAIVPIDQIIWIYKYSTMNKFLWYHFSISYTLHITAHKYLYLQCPKNIKSDIDGIMDYLEEANHDILVGFTEENRLKVQEIQGAPLPLKKILNFLKKKI